MDFDKFTEKSRGFLQKSQTLASRSHHQSLEPDAFAWLRVMLDDPDGLVRKIIDASGGDNNKLSRDVDVAVAKFPVVQGPGASGLRISTDLAKILMITH